MKYILMPIIGTVLFACNSIKGGSGGDPKYDIDKVQQILLTEDCKMHNSGGDSIFKCDKNPKVFFEKINKNNISSNFFLPNVEFLRLFCTVGYTGKVESDPSKQCNDKMLTRYKDVLFRDNPEQYKMLLELDNAIKANKESEAEKKKNIELNKNASSNVYNNAVIYEYNKVFNKNVADVRAVMLTEDKNLGQRLYDLSQSNSVKGGKNSLDTSKFVIYPLYDAIVEDIIDDYMIVILRDKLSSPYERFYEQKIIVKDLKGYTFTKGQQIGYGEHFVVYKGEKTWKTIFGEKTMQEFGLVTGNKYLLNSAK